MLGAMDRAFEKLLIRICPKVLESLEDYEVAVHADAKAYELRHLPEIVHLVSKRKLQLGNNPVGSQPAQKMHILEKDVMFAKAAQFLESFLVRGIDRYANRTNLVMYPGKFVPFIFAKQGTVRNNVQLEIGTLLVVD